MAEQEDTDKPSFDLDLRKQEFEIQSPVELEPCDDFSKLGLRDDILQGIFQHYKTPAKIQQLAIPAIIKHRDKSFIGQAQSGSGKTLAFVISMLSIVDDRIQEPQALCIAPTRELVMQNYTVAKKLTEKSNIQILLDVPEERIPAKITHQIVIGSPGRIFGSIDRGKLPTSLLKMFVIDEADDILAFQGQKEQLMKIFPRLPKDCQVCLFSATFDESVKALSREIIKEPCIKLFLKKEELSVEKLIQTKIICATEQDKFRVLNEIFSHVSVGQCIIFAHTRQKARAIYKFLQDNQHEVSILYGADMPPEQRDKTISNFRLGKNRILVSTNVLARGIDVLQVSLVINFDIPMNKDRNPDPDTYLHRVGRTARFNKPGLAINFIHDDYSAQNLRIIANTYSLNIQEIKTDQLSEIGDKLEQMQNSYKKFEKK